MIFQQLVWTNHLHAVICGLRWGFHHHNWWFLWSSLSPWPHEVAGKEAVLVEYWEQSLKRIMLVVEKAHLSVSPILGWLKSPQTQTRPNRTAGKNKKPKKQSNPAPLQPPSLGCSDAIAASTSCESSESCFFCCALYVSSDLLNVTFQ